MSSQSLLAVSRLPAEFPVEPGCMLNDSGLFELSKRVLQASGFDPTLYSEDCIRQAAGRLREVRGDAQDAHFDSPANLQSFIDSILINDTHFFRANVNWDDIRDSILPRLLTRSGAIRIASVGCSFGRECLSLACLIVCRFPGLEFDIFGYDCDEAALQKMNWYLNDPEGQAEAQEMLEIAAVEYVPSSIRIPKVALLAPRIHPIRKNVFQEPPDAEFDLIICANVLRHLNTDGKDILGVWLANALAPEGFLVTGEQEGMTSFCEDKLQKASEIGWGIFSLRNREGGGGV